MPPAPPEGWRLCAKPGRPLVYCGDGGYELYGLPADYAKRAAAGWGWSRVRVLEESNIDPRCVVGTVCRTDYRIENSSNGDVFTIHILVPASITAPPSE